MQLQMVNYFAQVYSRRCLMASIRTRERKGGDQHSVLWRDESGKQTSLTFPSLREAENCKRLVEANGGSLTATLGALQSLAKRIPTLTQVMAEHIDGLPSVTERSRADYRRDAKRHIEPHLGWRPVDQVTPSHIREWLKTLAATEMADKTIANIHGLLSASITTAMQAGYRLDNPCRGIRLPRRNDHESTEMVFLTKEEWAVLDKELGKVLGGWHQLMFRTLYLTGMRWGEIVALQVGDLSFDTKPPFIKVNRASRRDEQSRSYIGPTKTRRSRRTIGINQQLADALQSHVKGRPRDALVFTSRTGTGVLHSNVRSRVWLPATKAAMDREKHGDAALTQRPRVHDLRHTHASQQIADGVDLLGVQRRLGHESLKTTADRYGHLMPIQQLASAESASRAMVW